jgi:CRP/FNR family transcriptional regulator
MHEASRVGTVSGAESAPGGSCRLCPTAGRCLKRAWLSDDTPRWGSALLISQQPARPGRQLYAAGDPAVAVYLVRSGCIKTFTLDSDGQQRVRGFHLPGDVVGLDAIDIGHYPDHAEAATASEVCRIGRGELQSMMAEAPVLSRSLIQRLAAELRLALALAGNYSADQRVAAFLLHMRDRLGGGEWLRLPMSRRDVASYLRLANETVCRTLARFEERGWIAASDKCLSLRQPAALWQLAEPVGLCAPPLRLAA